MRQFFANTAASRAVLLSFALAFAWNSSDNVKAPLVSSRTHSSNLISLASGPTMPPPPWQDVKVASGPTMPPPPWQDLRTIG